MHAVVYSTRVPVVENGIEKDTRILEIWIEALGICINEKNGALRSTKPRMALNHFGTYNISDEFCEIVKSYVETMDKFEAGNAKVFQALKGQLVNIKNQHNKVNQ